MKKPFLNIIFLLLLVVACQDDNNALLVSPAPETEDNQTSTPLLPEDDNPTMPLPTPRSEIDTVETPSPPTLPRESITIRFAVQDFEVDFYERLIEAFETDNPTIAIELVSESQLLSEPGDNQTLQLAQAVDLFSSLYALPESRAGLVRDLTPFIEADPTFDVADFYPNALQEQNGQLFVLPTSLQFNLLFYNRALFDAVGVAYPEPGWTWETFRETANALTVREDGEVGQWGFVNPTPAWVSLIEGRLIQRIVNTNTSSARLRFQDEDVLAVVQSYVDLAQEDGAAVYASELDLSIESLFGQYPEALLIESGQAAMWPESYSSAVPLDENFALDWGVVPYPGMTPDASTTLIIPSGLVMSAGTTQPDAVWRWMVFLSHQPPSSFFGNFLPARASVAQASGYWDNPSPNMREAMQFALAHSYTIDSFAAYAPLITAMQAILAGEKTAEAALAEAQLAAETILAETAATQPPDLFTVEGDTSSNGDVANIDFILFNGIDLERYQALAEAFTLENDGLQVTILPRGGADFRGSAANSDCFQWSPIPFEPDYRTMVLSLDPLIDADPDFDLSDFYPFLVEQFRSQGQLWGLPGSVQLTLIEYNKALFDEAGHPYPTLTWTLDDFLDTAVALTDSETEQVGFVVDAFENTFLTEMLLRLGVPLIDTSQTPPTLLLNDPDMIAAMRWYTDLSTVHGVKPALGIGPFDDREVRQQLIANEQAAMWTTLGIDAGVEIPGRDALQIGVAPLPTNSEATANMSPASGFYISANTDQVRDCWEWLKFLTEQPTLTSGLPARRSVAESAAYAQSVGEERAAANLQSIPNISGSAVFQIYTSDNGWLSAGLAWPQQAYTDIVNGTATVEQALEAAQQKFDAYRSCIIENDGFSDAMAQSQCVTMVDSG